MFFLSQTGWRGFGPTQWLWSLKSHVGSVYQPLAWFSYGIDYALWGMVPGGYHLQSVVWHALSAILMFLVTRCLLAAAKPPSPTDEWELDAAALFGALAFAIHPLRVESVSWASERRDVLCGALVLAAVWAYLGARQSGQRPRTLALVGALMLLALLAKGMALMLPIALLAVDYYPLRRIGARGEGVLAALREKISLMALSTVFGLAGLMAQERIRWTYEQHGLTARVVQASYAFVFYIWKTFWPSGLMPLYELRPPMNPYEFKFLLSLMVFVAVLSACWRLRHSRPWLAASVFWYSVLLFPVSGLFQFGPQLVADRYSYMTTLPLAVLAGACVREGLARRRRLSLCAAFAAIATLLTLCVRQQSYWRSSDELWARVLSGDPQCATAHGALAFCAYPKAA